MARICSFKNWQTRKDIKELGRVWIYVTFSFLFYIPVAVGAGAVPLLGMLMLPKTVCYMLLVWVFWQEAWCQHLPGQ